VHSFLLFAVPEGVSPGEVDTTEAEAVNEASCELPIILPPAVEPHILNKTMLTT